jgi:hypothetical protein
LRFRLPPQTLTPPFSSLHSSVPTDAEGKGLVEIGQGYLFSKAVPAADIPTLLNHERLRFVA